MKPSLDGTSTKLVPLCSSQKVVSYVIFWQTKVTWFLLSSSENRIFSKFSSFNMACIDLVILQKDGEGRDVYGPKLLAHKDRPMDPRFKPDLEDSVANPWQLIIQTSNSLFGYSFHSWIFLFQFSIDWQAFDFLHLNLWFHQSSLNFGLKVHHKIFLHQHNLKWFSGGIISQMIRKCFFLFSENLIQIILWGCHGQQIPNCNSNCNINVKLIHFSWIS